MRNITSRSLGTRCCPPSTSNVAPGSGAYTPTAPTSYTLPAEGTYTLYAWARDSSGNVSSSVSAGPVTGAYASGPFVDAFGSLSKARWNSATANGGAITTGVGGITLDYSAAESWLRAALESLGGRVEIARPVIDDGDVHAAHACGKSPMTPSPSPSVVNLVASLSR